jgi:hypothetical protein
VVGTPNSTNKGIGGFRREHVREVEGPGVDGALDGAGSRCHLEGCPMVLTEGLLQIALTQDDAEPYLGKQETAVCPPSSWWKGSFNRTLIMSLGRRDRLLG